MAILNWESNTANKHYRAYSEERTFRRTLGLNGKFATLLFAGQNINFITDQMLMDCSTGKLCDKMLAKWMNENTEMCI